MRLDVFIDDQRHRFGIETICKYLSRAPSIYFEHKARERDPSRLPERYVRDAALCEKVKRVHAASRGRYGARKVWRELPRQGVGVTRCTVERVMRQLELKGVSRGGFKRTMVAAKEAPARLDLVRRGYSATRPNQLWVSDLTHARIRYGFVYVAFIIDAFLRRIVGWRVSRSLQATLVLDALEQALHAYDREELLVVHSDRGRQYAAVRYTQRLAEAGIATSVGSKGGSFGNALAETIIGLYKTEVIYHEARWPSPLDVEIATL